MLTAIANDCVANKMMRTDKHDGFASIQNKFEFTAEQETKYEKICDEFWGGYAYLQTFSGEMVGFIRLYSPQGSGKWWFPVKDGRVGDIEPA